MEIHCSECGSTITESAPAGLCPKCLLKLAASPEGEGSAEAISSKSFANYELIQPIGQGGMGIVWKARQRNLNRIVALKMMLGGPLSSETEIKRFHAEAKAAATLQHPNVVAIHEVGECDGRHFFSMDYVEGKSLSDVVRRTPLPPERAARYVQIIAEAIHYAHQRGILHRDLKPHNVLIDTNDQPRVTDFGLARQLELDSDLTVSGAILGTPSYMPPEQAAGKRREISARSDVYSIGAILYDCITGRPPFRADTPVDTLRQVLDADPAPPRLLNRKVPRDLEVICLKCLAKDQRKRYQTAQELADDLGRFLRHEPIEARPASRANRLWRWCRRKPAIAALTGATILLFVMMAVAAILFRRDTLDNNVHAARLAAQTVHGELLQLARGIEITSADPELSRLLKAGNQQQLTQFLQRRSQLYGTNATGWLQFENWLLLDPNGRRLARWPEESHLTDRSFRDYYRGPLRAANLGTNDSVHFSRVYESFDDGLYKFGLTKVVRTEEGRITAIVGAMVSTTSTEGNIGLTTPRRKTVLVGACDTNSPLEKTATQKPLPDFVIMLHPAFRSREPAVPIQHPNISRLLNGSSGEDLTLFDRDSRYRDPVARRHPQYLGRWLAGFAPVRDTPFLIIFQTRDWISDAQVFALISGAALFASFLAWRAIRRRRNRLAGR